MRGDLFVLFCFLRRGSREADVELFDPASSDKMHENVSKMCEGRFKLGIRKHYFQWGMVKHWNRLPKRYVISVSNRYLENAHNWGRT